MFAKRVLLLLFLALAFPAEASERLEAALDACARGEFREAAQMARELGTSEGMALAARAELAEGDYLAPRSSRRDEFERAARDAREAIALDPQNPDGHLYLAVALGFLGRIDGSIVAHFAGYAEEAREHIDRALAIEPANPWANALLGGWNLEIVRDGGPIGESLYGASLEKGVSAYKRALDLDVGNAAIAYQYALQLAALGGSRRVEARRVLARTLLSHPNDASEILAYRRAEELMSVLDMRDEARLRGILRDRLGISSGPVRSAERPGNGRSIGSPR